jgi:hypothetical protein
MLENLVQRKMLLSGSRSSGAGAFSGRAWLAEAPIASASEIRALAQAWSIKSYFDQTATVVVMVVAIF